MSYIYIASPYTHADPKVREARYKQACYYVVGLLGQHKVPYSPIVANHRLMQEFNLPYDVNSWMAYDMAMLSAAKEMHVLTLDGWQDSVGVTAEVAFWRGAKQGQPLYFIELDWTKLGNAETNIKKSEALCAPTRMDG